MRVFYWFISNKYGNIGTTHLVTESQWKSVLMREIQCRTVTESAAVACRVLITC